MSRKIIKPSELNKSFLKNIEDRYGAIDYENDFFSSDMKMYYKTTSKDEVTGKVGHKPIRLASFINSFNKFLQALQSLEKLSRTKETSSDVKIDELAIKLRELFNKYRTHLRNNYPEQYKNIRRRLNEINKRPLNEELNKYQKFQNERVKHFEIIRKEMNNILTSLSNYENDTVEYYKDNPTSFDVVYPTTLILDYIQDIKILLKEQK